MASTCLGTGKIQVPMWLTMGLGSFAVLGMPDPVQAHATNTGFGPFYDGLAHLFLTPEDLLSVIVLTLLAGMQGPRHSRLLVFTLPAAWFAGMTGGLMINSLTGSPWLTPILMIGLGVMVAANLKLPIPFLILLAAVLGLLHGYLNGTALARLGTDVLAVSGTVAGVFVVASLVAGQIVSLHSQWARIAVRVAGSWITAIGLLMLGWTVRG